MSKITNFRDIGGIKNKEGYEVVKQTFLRSGELSGLSKQQSQELENQYRLGKIIDLRSNQEVTQRPDVAVPNTEYIHIDILQDVQDEGASIEDFVQIGSPEKAVTYMEKLYTDIPLDATAQKGYQQFFDEILALKEKESVLFHCFAGKDRTGIGAALILEMLQVPRTSIYTDYLLTNQLRVTENEAIIQQAAPMNLSPESIAALQVALNVDRRYLDTFYQTVEQNYGSIENYLTEALKITSGTRTEFKQRFLHRKQ